MTARNIVARVTKVVNKTSTADMPIIAVRFHLLQSVPFKGKRVRILDTQFSLNPQALWRLARFLDATEYPRKNIAVTASLPNLHGRYCRLAVEPEYTSYEGKMIEHLRIRDFMTVNQPIHTSPIDRANDALAELRLTAHINLEGQLIVTTPPTPEENKCDEDED